MRLSGSSSDSDSNTDYADPLVDLRSSPVTRLVRSSSRKRARSESGSKAPADVFPNLPAGVKVPSRPRTVQQLQDSLDVLKSGQCYGEVEQLLRLSFNRQQTERALRAAEHKLKKLDTKINEELTQLAVRVHFRP